ncbi:MAG: carboxymuconolactone decarboxylase family protein [Novosphingobium sp.]|nr:carboxymuconolactone decarboxylase family protein [Novosphingobium sp.]
MNGERVRIAKGLGGPVRIEALPENALRDSERKMIQNIRDITGYPQEAPMHPFFLTLARSPDIFSAFTRLGIEAMATSALGKRERELVILRTGWLCDAPYQWGEHVSSGRDAGLTDQEIERIKLGSQADGWSAPDRALLKAVEEMQADRTIHDATWVELAKHFDERQLIELPILSGHYNMTAMLQNALRFPPNRDMDGNFLPGMEWDDNGPVA